ncbi:MAG: hypothetical protein ACKOFT_02880, partial [Actinomycetota bacterium]
MAHIRFVPLAVALVIAWCGVVRADDAVTAFVGGRVIPVGRAELPAGTVVIRGGTIVAVGSADSTPVPPDAQRIDTTG